MIGRSEASSSITNSKGTGRFFDRESFISSNLVERRKGLQVYKPPHLEAVGRPSVRTLRAHHKTHPRNTRTNTKVVRVISCDSWIVCLLPLFTLVRACRIWRNNILTSCGRQELGLVGHGRRL